MCVSWPPAMDCSSCRHDGPQVWLPAPCRKVLVWTSDVTGLYGLHVYIRGCEVGGSYDDSLNRFYLEGSIQFLKGAVVSPGPEGSPGYREPVPPAPGARFLWPASQPASQPDWNWNWNWTETGTEIETETELNLKLNWSRNWKLKLKLQLKLKLELKLKLIET